MADTVREIERKYEATDDTELPDLTGVNRVAAVVEQGVESLDATYYDTADQRLAADGITLRRRTGGKDAGWHLKLPVPAEGAASAGSGQVRDEVQAPLSDTPPKELTDLVHSRVRGRELLPVVRLRTRRSTRLLQDAAGTPLAEVATDAVWARRAGPAGEEDAAHGEARWHEIEVELTGAAGGDAGLLDDVGRALAVAGVRPARAASKLARALAETAPATAEGSRGAATAPQKPGNPSEPSKHGDALRKRRGKKSGKARQAAADVVLAYVEEQVRAIVERDPAVRRDLPDSVHQMRVATRRLRSVFRSSTKVLDRAVTEPLGVELKWLAAELGVDRDREVLTERLDGDLAELPEELRFGPVAARLRIRAERSRPASRQKVLAALDGERYLSLLEALEAFLAEPPLRGAAGKPAPKVLAKAVLKDHARLAGRMETARDLPAGPARDLALHRARKAAKRARYAAEAARPALGRPAKKYGKRIKRVQQSLGDHQDSVVAREALRELAAQAQTAGEAGFPFGLMYGREEARAAERERELPGLWNEASRRKHRDALRR
ncbi:CHAD domain-containing protein [Streptomyces sp. NPDC017993]|uniref:CYTH and CHAD domain-containing protein n=1 Tax=Streptomyces sp. NPDC017993 TaxID=3365027 RepID=UPI0037A9AC6E